MGNANKHTSISVDECLLVFLIQDDGHSVFCTTIAWLSPWHGDSDVRQHPKPIAATWWLSTGPVRINALQDADQVD